MLASLSYINWSKSVRFSIHYINLCLTYLLTSYLLLILVLIIIDDIDCLNYLTLIICYRQCWVFAFVSAFYIECHVRWSDTVFVLDRYY